MDFWPPKRPLKNHGYAPSPVCVWLCDGNRTEDDWQAEGHDKLHPVCLVVFAGEFGRTTYGQGNPDRNNYGRDHHPRCFTTWMAGGGIKGGISYGETDDFCYNVAKDPVHIRDFHATMLHQLGIDHKRLTFPYQGLDLSLPKTPSGVLLQRL